MTHLPASPPSSQLAPFPHPPALGGSFLRLPRNANRTATSLSIICFPGNKARIVSACGKGQQFVRHKEFIFSFPDLSPITRPMAAGNSEAPSGRRLGQVVWVASRPALVTVPCRPHCASVLRCPSPPTGVPGTHLASSSSLRTPASPDLLLRAPRWVLGLRSGLQHRPLLLQLNLVVFSILEEIQVRAQIARI